jgi:NAD(P)H dehydrogenase (quinone)
MARSILLVTCHPNPESLCGRIAGAVSRTVLSSGNALQHDDLEQLNFCPTISAKELSTYPTGLLPIDIEPLARNLQAADTLVFIFPVWMYGLPARLKGYFDRVWRPGVSFELGPQGVKPLLYNVRSLVVIATHGAKENETMLSGDASEIFFKTSIQSVLPNLEDSGRFDFYGLDTPIPELIAAKIDDVRQFLQDLSRQN